MRYLLAVLLLTLAAAAQDHAPTVEQCRADYNLWTSDSAAANAGFPEVSFLDLTNRATEMGKCFVVDVEWSEHFQRAALRSGLSASMSYDQAASLFGVTAATRMNLFLRRHGLMDKFLSEDQRKENRRVNYRDSPSSGAASNRIARPLQGELPHSPEAQRRSNQSETGLRCSGDPHKHWPREEGTWTFGAPTGKITE